jgi:hypothetical protein
MYYFRKEEKVINVNHRKGISFEDCITKWRSITSAALA